MKLGCMKLYIDCGIAITPAMNSIIGLFKVRATSYGDCEYKSFTLNIFVPHLIIMYNTALIPVVFLWENSIFW